MKPAGFTAAQLKKMTKLNRYIQVRRSSDGRQSVRSYCLFSTSVALEKKINNCLLWVIISSISLTGWLQKSGAGVFASVRWRYFVLKGTELQYFELCEGESDPTDALRQWMRSCDDKAAPKVGGQGAVPLLCCARQLQLCGALGLGARLLSAL